LASIQAVHVEAGGRITPPSALGRFRRAQIDSTFAVPFFTARATVGRWSCRDDLALLHAARKVSPAPAGTSE
jgi:hypothetical protein